jgi:hypothetical protein
VNAILGLHAAEQQILAASRMQQEWFDAGDFHSATGPFGDQVFGA